MSVSDPTRAVYDTHARRWRDARLTADGGEPHELARLAAGRGAVLDLGCGPGWHLDALGPDAVGVDSSRAMLDLVSEHAPGAPCVQADLGALPFRPGSLGGGWASRSYLHVPRPDLPAALADLHRSLAVGAPVELHLLGGDADHVELPDDDFPGRRYSRWPADMLRRVVAGAGFGAIRVDEYERSGLTAIRVRARRDLTLPDYVGADLRLLLCGLNPSVYSAEAGVGFARPGNRFWPAMVAVGLCDRPRDPRRLLLHERIGMTDLVKRATRRASDLDRDEYRSGVERLRHLVEWLRPGSLCVVGLTGWRAAVDRRAVAGPQPETFGGRPVYVMPNTSGLNAHCTPAEFRNHLLAAAALAATLGPNLHL